MKIRRSILILWGIVLAAYALIVLLDNPLRAIPEPAQRAIYDEVVAYLCESDRDPDAYIAVVGSANGVSPRTILLTARRGLRRGWAPGACITEEMLYPSPLD
jgi:hypothetical protein